MEKGDLFRDAEQWLNDNPGKNLGHYRKETGYTGPNLKRRNKKEEPIRVSYEGKSADAETKRKRLSQPKTEDEAKYFRDKKTEAKIRSQSTLHQHAYGGRPSIAEHNVSIARGGTNEYASVSDPDFKNFKDNIERDLPKTLVGDIDDVTGGVRVIPTKHHNKFQPTSRQPGITFELGDSIDFIRQQIRFLESNPMARRSLAMLPVVGLAASGEDAMARQQKAEQTGNILDQAQAGLAAVGMDFEPADWANTAIDLVRAKGAFNVIRGRSGAMRAAGP